MDLDKLFVSYENVRPVDTTDFTKKAEIEPYDRMKQYFSNSEKKKETKKSEDNSVSGFQGWRYTAPTSNITGNNSEFRTKVFDYLKGKGLDNDYAVRGIYGNLMQESSGRIDNRGDGGSSYGIAQWHNDRMNNLFNKYGSNPTLDNQLDYLWEELNGPYKKVLDQLRNSKSVEDATRIFQDQFERPDPKYANFNKRLNYANS